jgi:radical SAM/Cys-rich protein
MSRSLLAEKKEFAAADKQLMRLSEISQRNNIPAFAEALAQAGCGELRAATTEIFQINVGKVCNQTCKHCHVDAAPDRKEQMSLETVDQCLRVLRNSSIPTVDITGGAPELNLNFRYLVESCVAMGKKVMVRCNLTVILSNKKYHDLPHFFAANKVEVMSSLPFYNASRTDKQRGEGVFEKSIRALQMLNEVGYGKENTGLILNLVYNPAGAFLPPAQNELETEFKKHLYEHFGIVFNKLLAITNMPISRFLQFLDEKDLCDSYLQKLYQSFNPRTISGLMCRNTISVGWDGYLYDCDFNQMLDIKLYPTVAQHIAQLNIDDLNNRIIRTHQHCYGCTAGSGSGCGGNLA